MSPHSRAPRLAPTAFAVMLLAAAPLPAQITNGSLTGPIKNNGVPPGWTILIGSPDTDDINSNVGIPNNLDFGATPSPSPDGGTWVGIGANGLVGFIERFGQTMTGLTVGQMYSVSWFASNFGSATLSYIQPNAIQMWIGGAPVAVAPTLPLGPGWFSPSLHFTAAATSQQLAFELGLGNKSYMGIDGITVGPFAPPPPPPPPPPPSTVPEPATGGLTLAGLAALGIVATRRRAQLLTASA